MFYTKTTIKVPPKVTTFSFGQEIQEGSQVQAFCTTSQGDQPFSFAWFKNGKKIFDSVTEKNQNHVSGKYELSYVQTISTILTIRNISEEDRGEFGCQIKNAGGESNFTTSLQVIGMLKHYG